MSGPNLRDAVRVVIIDHRDRVLLVRFEFSHATVWATPGGGVEAGEDPVDALHRELVEGVGLRDAPIGPTLWMRTHRFETTTATMDNASGTVSSAPGASNPRR